MLTLEHIGICAENTTMLKDWYVKLFNWKVVYDNKKEMPTYFLLMDDHNMIEFYPMENRVQPENKKYQGIRHIAFGTVEIEKEVENLLKHGVEMIEPLTVSPKGIKTAWFKDPEGNILHFIQRPESLY